MQKEIPLEMLLKILSIIEVNRFGKIKLEFDILLKRSKLPFKRF